MRYLQAGGVILGALVITTLGISASSFFSHSSSLLGGQRASVQNNGCPAGMVLVTAGMTFSCADIYEASPGDGCSYKDPQTTLQTQANINEFSCAASSQTEVQPWTYVSRAQAQVLCARAGKRLPTATEWYTLTLGTPNDDENCNTNSTGKTQSGTFMDCHSAIGVFDAVGNVWEWTTDDVIEGVLNGLELPEEGYVTQVSSGGMALVTGHNPVVELGLDYLWTQKDGVFGLLRGGFYGSDTDAGVYAIQAKTSPNVATEAIGFRCVF